MDTIREDPIGRAITWSLIGHGAIALIVVLKSLVFPGQPLLISPPALRVDLVGLPDLLKKDLAKISQPAPPKEAKEVTPPKTVTAEPLPKADEMVLNPKKTQKAKINSALARIRALERLKDNTEDAEKNEESIVIKGNQVSAGTSLSGNARENAQAGYYDLARDSLVEFWTLPPWLARQKLSAQVQIRIDPAGRVLSSKFVKSSGNPTFDAAILNTIRDAQPFPRPPKELLSSLADDGIVFGFPL